MSIVPVDETPQLELVSPREGGPVFVNAELVLYEAEEERVAMVAGLPVYRYHRDDQVAEDLFVAQAQESGWAKASELAAALGRGIRTIQRRRAQYVEKGVAGLVPDKRGPKGPRLGEAREAAIRRWDAEGVDGAEMARRLKVGSSTVYRTLRRLGLRPSRTDNRQQLLVEPTTTAAERTDDTEPTDAAVGDATPEEADEENEVCGDISQVAETDSSPDAMGSDGAVKTSAASLSGAPVPSTLDADPMNRTIDRMLASRGQLLDAAPLFASKEDIPRLGVLIAVPLIVATGLFEVAHELYGDLGHAFYGLRTSLLALVVFALLRIKHPENLKEHAPPELGRVLGLDRAPEVKTLRRKLRRLAVGPVEPFLEALVRRRVQNRAGVLGFYYVDGHVRVYNGKAHLPKTHVARLRLSLPAAQDVWVHDSEGEPLFFVTQEAHPSLVSVLPGVVDEIRRLAPNRRPTMVFDRGGWSPKLFARLAADDCDVLTYRKGKAERVSDDAFVRYTVPGTDGREHWDLHEMSVRVRKGFWMRQVTRRKGDHQTQILTTRQDLPITEVAHRMFNRWRQENFFKYMRQEFAIDALLEYGTERADPEREVPNPTWTALDKKLKKAKAEVTRLEARYGAAAADNPESRRPTIRGFKIANGTEIGIPLRKARAQVLAIKAKRDALPRRVNVADLRRPLERLPEPRKRLSDGLKMLAYQVETDLVRAVTPFYARSIDEGRTLISAALQSTGTLEVTLQELRITLASQSSPHRTLAIAKLCDTLNDTKTCFPGTSLRMRFAVNGAPRVT